MVPLATREREAPHTRQEIHPTLYSPFETDGLVEIILRGATFTVSEPRLAKEDTLEVVRAQIIAARNALPGVEVCASCGCTPANPCRIASGEECSWISRSRTYCSAPKCVKAFYEKASEYQRPRRKAGAR